MFGGTITHLLISLPFVVHVIRTGRNQAWILAIVLLPVVGWIAYVVVELIPEWMGGRTARRAKVGMQRIIDPNRDMRRAAQEVEISGSVDARRRLGQEYFERGQYDEAIDTYKAGLKGIFEHDPTLLLGLAEAQFAKQDTGEARRNLEALFQHNPDFKSYEAKLLYARALEATGELDAAEREYALIAGPFPGAEARLRYALLLKKRGKSGEAQRLFKDLLDGARLGPAHYRRSQARWLDIARRELG